jgi:hypothetical protein
MGEVVGGVERSLPQLKATIWMEDARKEPTLHTFRKQRQR